MPSTDLHVPTSQHLSSRLTGWAGKVAGPVPSQGEMPLFSKAQQRPKQSCPLPRERAGRAQSPNSCSLGPGDRNSAPGTHLTHPGQMPQASICRSALGARSSQIHEFETYPSISHVTWGCLERDGVRRGKATEPESRHLP